MKKSIFAHTEVVYTYSKYFYDDFIELMSRILGYIHYQKLNYETDLTLPNE